MGSVSVSSCICCMFVSCVHPVAVLNAAFCMTCSLLMLVEDAIGDHTECQRVECAFTSPVRTECGMFVMYCMQCCMSVSAVL